MPGFDAAGSAESIGKDVVFFKEGEEVFYAVEIGWQRSDAELQVLDQRIVGQETFIFDLCAGASRDPDQDHARFMNRI